MNINWFPGHMTKSLRMMEENIKGVDAIGYVLDCRAPFSCFNPAFEQFTGSKPYVFLLNKSDLADDSATASWLEYFKKSGRNAVDITANKRDCIKRILSAFSTLKLKNVEKFKQKGVFKPVRIMIIGVPNSGKSSIINLLSGKKNALTGNKPGVTRGKQWIRLDDGLELLDTPGTLWPKFENQEAAKNLLFIGSISDNVADTVESGEALLEKLLKIASGAVEARYNLTASQGDIKTQMKKICLSRGFLLKGEPDVVRCAAAVLDDFRKCRIGKISLETPESLCLT